MQRNRRHDRVRELLKRAVGEVIREMFSIQEVGVVSVTDVGISNDLRSAVVFLSFTAEDRRKAFGKIQEITAPPDGETGPAEERGEEAGE